MNRWTSRTARFGAVLVAAMALLTAPFAAAQGEPLKIRISWIAPPNSLPSLLMEKPELMMRAGQSYVVDAVRDLDMAQSIAALASGDLDIALLTFSAFARAVQNEKLEDLRIISDEFSDGMPGYYSAQFLTLKEGPLNTIEDLKGKSVAVNSRGNISDMALRAIARRHKLEEKRDFTVVEMPLGDMKTALLEKNVDVIGLAAPALSTDPALREAAHPLFTQRDALGPTAQVIWVAREGFLQRHRAPLIDFMADALRVRRYFTDPKKHRETVDIVSRISKLPAAQLDPWLFTASDYYRTPDGVLDINILQNNIDKMAQLGLLKSGFDARKYQDFTLVKDAAELPK